MERERCQGLAREAGAIYAHARRAGGINSTLDTSSTDHPLVWERDNVPFPASGEDGSGQSPEKA